MYFLIKNRLFLQVCVDSLVTYLQDEFIKVIYYLLKIIQSFDWLRAVDEIVISVR